MKARFTLLASFACVVALVATTAGTAANNKPACGGGKMIVNVTYSLYNDADSGFFGDWAVDNLNRHLQVYDQGAGTFCAVVNDTGQFVTTGPLSPQNGVPLAAGIKGVINGGYTTTMFTGTLNPSPAYATKGNLGTFDANGPHPSYASYFSSTAGDDLAVWGWTYHTAKNGDWTNASSGSSGDISGS